MHPDQVAVFVQITFFLGEFADITGDQLADKGALPEQIIGLGQLAYAQPADLFGQIADNLAKPPVGLGDGATGDIRLDHPHPGLLEDRPKLLFTAPQRRFGGNPLGNITGGGVDGRSRGRRAPLDPAIVAAAGAIPVDKVMDLPAVVQPCHRRPGRGQVVGVNIVEKRRADQLVHRIAKHPFPLRVESEEQTVGVGDTEQIEALVKIIL